MVKQYIELKILVWAADSRPVVPSRPWSGSRHPKVRTLKKSSWWLSDQRRCGIQEPEQSRFRKMPKMTTMYRMIMKSSSFRYVADIRLFINVLSRQCLLFLDMGSSSEKPFTKVEYLLLKSWSFQNRNLYLRIFAIMSKAKFHQNRFERSQQRF